MNQNQKKLSEILEQITNLNSYEFSILASILGLILCPPSLVSEKKQALGNFFMLLAQTIVTLSSQEIAQKSNNSSVEFEDLKKQIIKNKHNIDEIINYIKNL